VKQGQKFMLHLWLWLFFVNAHALEQVWPPGFVLSASSQEEPFAGVIYQRLIFIAPRLMSVHVLRLDLNTPGLRFAVCAITTDKPRVVKLTSVRQCAEQEQAQLAVNAGFFDNSLGAQWRGEGALQSLSVRQGQVLSPWSKAAQFHYGVNISEDNQITFIEADANDPERLNSQPKVKYYNAVAGGVRLLKQGKRFAKSQNVHPQTAIGLVFFQQKQQELLLVVVDGRQPGFSEGISYVELADFMQSLGASEALSLDGGGSSTLLVQDKEGKLQLQNRPSDGFERLVGDSLLIFLLPSE
jgi:exopolysaccharide biosynthesis protein